jgi:hypothetical protein
MDDRRRGAIDLMTGFAGRTGLAGGGDATRRYLWTDAYATCNFLGLSQVTGDPQYIELAFRLVERVHRTLGRYRPDDPRTGWIGGQTDDEGERHPTRGGLRIGKPLPERAPDEPIDDRLEWDRDGQYFHYLTKWMHALDGVARATGRTLFATWARELAIAAHRGFVYAPRGASKRMYWKASTDLSRPLVASMGHHDPLDGFVTYLQIESCGGGVPSVADAARDFAVMVAPARLATDDPLGIGGLLVDAYRMLQLVDHGVLAIETIAPVLAGALAGLRSPRAWSFAALGAEHRLAFRELGLAIGLSAVERMASHATGGLLRSYLDALSDHAALRETIVSFWLDPVHRRTATYRGHVDINDVMLATSLEPSGAIEIGPPLSTGTATSGVAARD